MAIYQYYLAVVPKEGVLSKHGSLPTEIGVSTKTGYFESDAKLYWKEINLKASEIKN